jgi:hypothetical protein
MVRASTVAIGGRRVLGAVLAAVLSATALAHAGPVTRACMRGCRERKTACITDARQVLRVAGGDCAAAASRRTCKREARARFRGARKACLTAAAKRCIPCCREGGQQCAMDDDFGNRFDVTYAGGTVVVAESVVDAHLLAANDDRSVLRFDAGAEEVRALAPGQVVVFAGAALGRVQRVDDLGSELVVTTEPTTLAEAITSGTFAWDRELRWDQVEPAALAQAVPGLVGQSVAPGSGGGGRAPEAVDGGIALELEVKPTMKFAGTLQGFEVEVEFTPAADRLNLSVVATRPGVRVEGVGFVSNFRHAARFELGPDDAVVAAEQTGMQGEMKLRWNAFQVGDPTLDSEPISFKLPVALPIPFTVGPIPVVLTVKATLQVVPVFEHTESGSSGGQLVLTYRSDQGFDVQDGATTPRGSLHDSLREIADAVTAGFGPTGFLVGVEFPRFELSLFGPLASAYVTLKATAAGLWTPGTTLTSDIPPCQKAESTLFAKAGFALGGISKSLLGVSGDTTLWEAPKQEVFKDGKPCSLDGR